VNSGRPLPAPAAVQELPRLRLEDADLREHLVDVAALALELLAPRLQRAHELEELRTLVGRRVVELEHLAHLGEREAQALAAQDELEAHVFALAVDAPPARAPGRDQPLVLVEADRAR